MCEEGRRPKVSFCLVGKDAQFHSFYSGAQINPGPSFFQQLELTYTGIILQKTVRNVQLDPIPIGNT
jgi:hypothetical protein